MQTLIENVNIINPFEEVKTHQNILIEDKYVASIENISKKAKVEKHEDIVKKVNF